jgi:hypothetical protein
MSDPDPARPLALLPEVDARRILRARNLRFRLLAPPFPALGVGTLRVLRVAERGAHAEIVAGYERYERLESPERRSPGRGSPG